MRFGCNLSVCHFSILTEQCQQLTANECQWSADRYGHWQRQQQFRLLVKWLPFVVAFLTSETNDPRMIFGYL
ncbi:hypothetical protein T01_3051 [Trichinella spiralis]|uniref:Uncharacterized protein n=1 Tax=Trichinella spiralis TaxID=6334 RepID=A0A0V1BM52_TRISP|nr:hypothetical protein T01_3051 [Trichinella spiralis]